MRSCDEIVELISASLDGELSAHEQAALDEHIAHCPACSALLDDLRALHTAAADWEDIPAPAGFTESVMSAIAAETVSEKPDNVIPFAAPKKAKGNHWKKWGVSAAAIAIVVLGAVSAPSLLGNFNDTKSAEPAELAYTAFDSVADSSVAQEAEDFDTVVNQNASIGEHTEAAYDGDSKTSSAEPASNEALDQKAGNSAPYDPNGNVPAPSTVPQDPADDSVSSKPPKERAYVGVLILEGMLDSLSGQEGAVSNDGTVTYLVSADVFAEVLKVLEAEKPVGYAYTAGTPDAPLGKIIVQSN